MPNKIKICQQALVMIGAAPITSFDDGTTEAIACETLYEDMVRDAIAGHRWRFATGMKQLARLSDAPSTKWDAAYQIPDDVLVESTVYVNGRVINFDTYEDMVFCDAAAADEVFLEGTFRVNEEFWPPYFVQLIIYRMASLLAHSIGEQIETAELLNRRALAHATVARNRDSQNRTAPRIIPERIVQQRFRNSRGYR